MAETFQDTKRVAGLLHVHPGSVLRMIARGDFPSVKFAGRHNIPTLALEEFLAARKVPVRAWAIRRKGTPHGQA